MSELTKSDFWSLPTVVLALAISIVQSSSWAAEITVDTGRNCTLAEAIDSANSDTAIGGCTAGNGDDTITLKTDILLTEALPDIISIITIEGEGHTIDGNSSVGPVLRITGRYIADSYGGSTAPSSLVLNQATVTGSSSSGIQIDARVMYLICTVSLTNSTVSGNRGDGIESHEILDAMSAISLTNSTISNNNGIGIFIHYYSTSLTVTNCTISDNGQDGIYSISFFSTIKGSIINDNKLSSPCIIDDINYNVFDCNSKTILSPLSDNGGTTKTHALVKGSPAIDLIPVSQCTLTNDQRGEVRPKGLACDAGSYESSQPDKVTNISSWLYPLLFKK